jgi:V8-like Glu-specific endopeptidase
MESKMKSRSVLLGISLLCVCPATLVLAQAPETRRPALPLPPPFASTEAASSSLKFDSGKSAEENARTLKAINDKIVAAQEQLKTIDRTKMTVRPQGGTPEALPPSQDRDRLSAVREAASWERVRRVFEVESQCGPIDDTVDVELYAGNLGPTQDFVKARQVSTGQVQWNASFSPILQSADDPGNVSGVRWCTGTLISDRLFITAGHCFDINSNGWSTPSRRVGNNFVSLTSQEIAPLMHINFNYQRNGGQCANPADARTCPVRAADTYPILRLLEHRRGGLDYAIVELGPGSDGQLAGARYAITAFDASSTGLVQANLLTIIQHPNGVPKRIGAGRQLRIAGNSVFYSQIDTLGGSSGAGVIDQTGKIVGIHTNGGCTETGGENSGVVLRAIAQVSDVIR